MEYKSFMDDHVDAKTLSAMTDLVTLCRQKETISLSFPLPSAEDEVMIHYFAALEHTLCIGVAAVCLFPLHSDENCCEFSYEITAFVHPDYRRQGIFRTLIELFLEKEQLTWQDPRIQFLSDRRCLAAALTAAAWNMKQISAEYLMQLDLSIRPDNPSPIRITRCRNRRLLASHYSHIFQMAPDIGRAYVDMILAEEENTIPFLIRMKNTPIGSGYLIQSNPEKAYLFSFGILPEYQGHGLGLASLQALKEFLPESCKLLTVQVSGQNIPACRLYEKAGFVMTQQLLYYGWK